MSKINILSKQVYNRIAAGEVVERPYSVIKELVENSVDAKSSEIYINIIGGGKQTIEVFDNGLGIEKDDMLKTVMPHATSKISNAEDLDSILTLGFRGEALASIASISEFRITSKIKEADIGYTLEVKGGENSELVEAPCNNGTFVSVNNLFFNTPARQKFLKSDKLEEKDISDMVSRLILANPNISFNYCIDNKTLIQSFGDGIEDAIISVYGSEVIKNCFKISNYINGVKIEGYIGKHNFTKPNRTYQTVILNGRYIVNSTIQSAIHNAYSEYLMKRQYPFFVLYITVPNEIVDVNVTPNKSDVRFVDNSVIYASIYSTISKVLDGTDSALNIIVPQAQSPQNNIFESQEEDNKIRIITSEGEVLKTVKYKKDNFDFIERSNVNVAEDEDIFSTSKQKLDKPDSKIDIFAENKKYIEELERKKREEEKQTYLNSSFELKYVTQVLNSYLLFEADGDLYFIDQHAAHERLLYNKLIYLRSQKELTIQPLLVPFELNLNFSEYELIERNLKYLTDFGFEIELTDSKLTVYSLPLEIVDIDLTEYFASLFSDRVLKFEKIPQLINEKIMQKACKAAVKAGMSLSKSQVDSLIRLLNGNINLKCPHGRPIAVRVSRVEIDKWFKRIV